MSGYGSNLNVCLVGIPGCDFFQHRNSLFLEDQQPMCSFLSHIVASNCQWICFPDGLTYRKILASHKYQHSFILCWMILAADQCALDSWLLTVHAQVNTFHKPAFLVSGPIPLIKSKLCAQPDQIFSEFEV